MTPSFTTQNPTVRTDSNTRAGHSQPRGLSPQWQAIAFASFKSLPRCHLSNVAWLDLQFNIANGPFSQCRLPFLSPFFLYPQHLAFSNGLNDLLIYCIKRVMPILAPCPPSPFSVRSLSAGILVSSFSLYSHNICWMNDLTFQFLLTSW